MAHYEVHRRVDDRWLLDAVFYDKATAIDDAKARIARARSLVAIRVLKVEEQASGFAEWIVYNDTTAEGVEGAAARRRRRHVTRRLRLLPRRVAATARNLAAQPAAQSSAWALLALILVGVVVILLAQRPPQGQGVWVFDRPDAWRPHTVRNPLTGEVSH